MILSALLVAASLSFDVVRDGVSACSVVASGEKSVDAAAVFFTNAVYRMSGAEIVVVGSRSCRKDIANSTLPLQLDTTTNRIVFDVKKAGLMEEDDWAIDFPDERTMKVTCSPRSARWAMNRLVEDWGVVFCQPGPHGTHYPRRTSLACARAARRGTAALRLSRDLYVEDPEWVRALGCKSLGDVKFFNHSMHAVLPTAKYGEEPWVSDVMPERDGKRVKPRNHYSGWQPCWASETGRVEAVKNICAYLRKHPEQQTYSLSVNDLEGYCECAKCRALNGGSFTNRCTFGFRHRKHSESYYQWVNAVAEGVRREFPDVWFGVLAYCGTIDPPSFPLNDHVVPFLCCDTYQAQDAKIMADRERLFAAWSEKASAFGLWDYAYGCRAYQAPRLYTKTMAKYFALKKRCPKLQAFFMEGDTFVGEGPKRYLFGKLISDPDCDAEAELDRWYRTCCGEPAADDLRGYYDLWERFYTEGDIKKTIWYTRGITGVYMDFGQRRYVFALKDGELEKADRLMARVVAAAEASGDADQRERARRLAEWHALYHARLVASGVGCADYEGKFHAADEVARFLAKLPEICTAHRQVAELTEKVIATRLADGGDDGRLKGHCDGFRTRQLNRTTNIVSLFNDALAFVGDPAVKRAMAAVADDARVDDLFRDSIRGLLDLSCVPNRFFPDGLSVADDLRLWTRVDHGIRPEDAGTAANGTKATRLVNEKGGWPAAIRFFPRVDTSTTYLFRARVTNESKAPLSIRMLFNTADPETAAGIGDNGGIEKIVPVKPGETKDLSLFCQKPVPLKNGKPPAARLYVILNGLPKGQGVVLDACEFRPLGKSQVHRGQEAGRGDYLDTLRTQPALAPEPFPDRLSAYVWRNWKVVPVDRLAHVVGATPEALTQVASEMGLKPQKDVSSDWRRKGYITVVKRNWHLLPIDQLLDVLDMGREEFAFRLVEDDFLSSKLGHLKPVCEKLVWDAEVSGRTRSARIRLSAILKEEGVDPNAAEERRFAFVDELSRVREPSGTGTEGDGAFDVRMVYPYFTEYGDLLMDDSLSTLPEGLFSQYAAVGVNAVWLHVVLRTLVTDPAFPEFGKDAERRKRNLRRIVARAGRHGVKIYLYLNEPRCMPGSFFDGRPDREGIRGIAGPRDQYALCTSAGEVKRYLREGARQLFADVKGLGGIFTITASENLTSCGSRAGWRVCPRCADRPRGEIIAEVNRLLNDGMKEGDPNAELIAWDWAWPEDADKESVPALAGTGCKMMTVSEAGVPICRSGVKSKVNEYSISSPGPSARAKDFWALAGKHGLRTMAKVQASVSWEFSPVPFLPVMDLVAEQAVNLCDCGVSGVMMAWSLGGYPSPNLEVYRDVRRGGTADEVLDRIARRRYGPAAVKHVRRAWRTMSEGFREFPMHMMTVYMGPQQLGPANPLYAQSTGYDATMVGFPYDDIGSWRSFYPEDVYREQMNKVAVAFAAGLEEFDAAVAAAAPECRQTALRDRGIVAAAALHFQSVVNQIDFVLARNRRGDKVAMRAATERELQVAKRFLPVVREDSRIGFEASCHYYYLPIDIAEKILLCRQMLDEGAFAK